ncbi:hypothetical protein [Pseudomonas fragi]|uniref:hypothetical protein n=1 Tax=Pseudomonas fragi TaxID=296 RepID=UPI001F31CF59|nr:hypothetical protein [Pseudomonas fragi]MCF6763392.1 hypothetical protein [Pseudomonas fragi]
MSSADFVIGYLCGVVIICLFMCIGIALHMAYTKMELMLGYLKNCTAIMVRAPLKNGGPWGRLLLIGSISGIITFPSFYLGRGELSKDDLINFPAHLKRKLVLLQWCIISLMSCMVLLVVIGKSGMF